MEDGQFWIDLHTLSPFSYLRVPGLPVAFYISTLRRDPSFCFQRVFLLSSRHIRIFLLLWSQESLVSTWLLNKATSPSITCMASSLGSHMSLSLLKSYKSQDRCKSPRSLAPQAHHGPRRNICCPCFSSPLLHGCGLNPCQRHFLRRSRSTSSRYPVSCDPCCPSLGNI